MFQALLSVAGGSGWALPFCGATGAPSMQLSLWHWHSSSVSEGCSLGPASGKHDHEARPCLPVESCICMAEPCGHSHKAVASVARRGCNARPPCSACLTLQWQSVLLR